MEILGPALVVGVIAFVVILGAWLVGRARQGRKRDAYLEFLDAHRPEVAGEFLMGSRASKSGKFDIALAIDDPKREIVLLSRTDGEVTERVYPFSDLTGVESDGRIISRGIKTQRTYSYERTMALTFADGTTHRLILETISDKHGRKGTEIVKSAFAPWEKALTMIVKGEPSVG